MMGKVEKLPVRDAQPETKEAPRPRRFPWRPVLLAAGPLLVVAAALSFYLAGGRYVGTDNAYIRAGLVELAPEIAGRVAEIAVTENQEVDKGALLFRVDPEPYRIALEAAQANLDAARDDLLAMRATYEQKRAQIAGAEADVAYYRRDFERQQDLAARNVAAETTLDQAKHAFNTAEQSLVALRQEARATLAQIGPLDRPVEQHPRFVGAKAELDKAARDLRLTEVHAPMDGIVTHVDTLQVGEYVTAGGSALAMVGNEALWVEANPKETDITYVKPGDEATVTVDAYPGRVWHAHVATLSPATGSEFSVLPAQNTTGNWVKVVQRVPLRLTLDETGDEAPALRAGLSVEVEIDTHHERSAEDLAHSLFGWLGA